MTRLGLADDAESIRRHWQAGDRIGAVRAVGDNLLEVCTLGTAGAHARERLTVYRHEGVALPVLVPAHGASPQQIADTLQALAPAGVLPA
jgi:hypothetical protein